MFALFLFVYVFFVRFFCLCSVLYFFFFKFTLFHLTNMCFVCLRVVFCCFTDTVQFSRSSSSSGVRVIKFCKKVGVQDLNVFFFFLFVKLYNSYKSNLFHILLCVSALKSIDFCLSFWFCDKFQLLFIFLIGLFFGFRTKRFPLFFLVVTALHNNFGGVSFQI